MYLCALVWSLRPAGQEPPKCRLYRPFDLPAVLKSVLDNVGVALAVIDSEHRFVYTNQAAFKMFGATENVPFAKWRLDYKIQDSQGREIPTGQAPLRRALAGKDVKPHDVRVTFPDGSAKWLHAAAHGFSTLGLTGVFVLVTDETEEVEMRKTIERTQHIEAFGILAGGLVHDFNNILSVLSGNITLALGDEGRPGCHPRSLPGNESGARQGHGIG